MLIMAYKAPIEHVDAFHFVQTFLLESFGRGVLTIKLHPIHWEGFRSLAENFVPQG
jgi:hypothetical protein